MCLSSLCLFFYIANKKWDTFLRDYIHWWRIGLVNWVLNEAQYPVHVVRYEDLQQDTIGEVKKMLKFLNVSYEDVDVESRMNQKESLQTFHRKHDASSDFEHYTPEQKARLKKSLLKVVQEAEACNKSSTLRLDKYLTFFQ